MIFKEDAWGRVKAGTLARVTKAEYCDFGIKRMIDVDILNNKCEFVEAAVGCYPWRFGLAEDKRI